MLLKYFYNEKVAHASYLLGCQATAEALIIDPGRDIEQYMSEASKAGLRIVGAAETHIHADYVSGARELAHRVGATLYLSDEGDADWKYRYLDEPGVRAQLLKDGDRFAVGNIDLEVLHTPGHTPEHLSFLVTDRGGGADRPIGIFTGDFVFVGAIGRPDLLEKAAGYADTAVAGAREMFKSIQRFKQLPDYLQVWPAHGAGSACGKDLGAIPSTTVGYEKLFNPALRSDNLSDFVEDLLADQPEPPTYFAEMKRVNKIGPRLLHGIHAPELLSAQRLVDLVRQKTLVIDTRPSDAFATEHMPGTINIPLPMLAGWAGWFVDYRRPLYLIVESVQAQQAARDLAYIGIDTLAGYFEPDAIAQLRDYGVQPASYDVMTSDELWEMMLDEEVNLIDVRNQTEWDGGHIPGARHIMLGYLADEADEAIDDRPIVVNCEAGGRSAIGASILKAHGAGVVVNLLGGYNDWVKRGLPIAE